MIFLYNLRSISYPAKLETFLDTLRILLKEFGRFSHLVSDLVNHHAETLSRTHCHPFYYLSFSSSILFSISLSFFSLFFFFFFFIFFFSFVDSCRTEDIHRDRVRKQIHRSP